VAVTKRWISRIDSAGGTGSCCLGICNLAFLEGRRGEEELTTKRGSSTAAWG
jgi:hypothetical protein